MAALPLPDSHFRRANFANASFVGAAFFDEAIFTVRAGSDQATFTGDAWFYRVGS
jgi:hypothetical protein